MMFYDMFVGVVTLIRTLIQGFALGVVIPSHALVNLLEDILNQGGF
jgi:hypothetical protein